MKYKSTSKKYLLPTFYFSPARYIYYFVIRLGQKQVAGDEEQLVKTSPVRRARSYEAWWIGEMSESGCLGGGQGFHSALFLQRRAVSPPPRLQPEGQKAFSVCELLQTSLRPQVSLQPRVQGHSIRHVLWVACNLNKVTQWQVQTFKLEWCLLPSGEPRSCESKQNVQTLRSAHSSLSILNQLLVIFINLQESKLFPRLLELVVVGPQLNHQENLMKLSRNARIRHPYWLCCYHLGNRCQLVAFHC